MDKAGSATVASHQDFIHTYILPYTDSKRKNCEFVYEVRRE